MSFRKAFKAGVLGAMAMTVLMAIARGLGVTSLNVELALGSFLTGSLGAGSWMLGFVMHLVVGGLLAQLYAFGFDFIAERSNVWIGAGFSLIHVSIAAVTLFLLGSVHPLMRNNGVLQAPGPFAINYGVMTAVMLVGLHLVYGAWVGSLYSVKPIVEEQIEDQEMPRAA